MGMIERVTSRFVSLLVVVLVAAGCGASRGASHDAADAKADSISDASGSDVRVDAGPESGAGDGGDGPAPADGGRDGDAGNEPAPVDAGSDGCGADCGVPRCGDGIVQSPGEQCDDGAANSATRPDACRLTCVRARCKHTVEFAARDNIESCAFLRERRQHSKVRISLNGETDFVFQTLKRIAITAETGNDCLL